MEEPIHILTLTKFTYGGETLSRLPDGRAVFVPYAMPGEEVRVRLVEERRRYTRAELLEVINPSPERITPCCNHFGVCGGCHYQHMPYETQLEAKAAILRDQLERIGKLVDPPVQAMVPSTNTTHYRNHVQFHLSTEGYLGYHLTRSQEVLVIQECHLPEPLLDQVWPQLDFEAIPGLERVGLRLGMGNDVQLILESSDLEPPELSVQDLPVSVVHLSPAGSLVLAGSEAVFIEVLGRPFRVCAGSFFQINTPMAGVMVEYLVERLSLYRTLSPDTTLIDVYSGVGLFSAFLAPRVGRLVGIEADSSASEDFVINLDEFDNVELYEAPAEIVLPQLDIKPDVILVDPPRAGIDRVAMDGLLVLEAPLVVYVSCDPATLGRDARRLLAGGYRLEEITPFDLFPQTYHIESISFWTRES